MNIYSYLYKIIVAIHNKNGKGLLPDEEVMIRLEECESQSTIKMEKGYYGNAYNTVRRREGDVAIHNKNGKGLLPCLSYNVWLEVARSQSTIKMEKGYY